jgi:PhnB protein
MQLNAYLTFNGQCEAAFQFYAQCPRGKIVTMMPCEGTPAETHVPPESRNKILRAQRV